MRRILLPAVMMAAFAATASAETVTLDPSLAPVGFLLGHWTSGDGKVTDIGGTSRGSSIITAEAGGAVLLRRDHTDVFDAGGKPTESFDQIMMIYPEGGSLRADYSDGTHVIHYKSAEITPDRSVVFTSAAEPGAPVFKLSYRLIAADTLDVAFAMAPPGQSEFREIASGSLHKAG